MKNFLQRWFITTLGVLTAAKIVNGVTAGDWQSLIIASLLLGILNAFLRPLLLFLSLPLLLVTLGLFTFVTYFRAVARSTGLPIMIYNNPISYANDITPEMFALLGGIKNFVALKESSGNSRRITDIINIVGDRYAIFTGVDDLLLEAAILGIDGWVAGSGIAFPNENQYLWDLTRAGEWDKARQIYRWFTPLLHLDTHVKFVQYIKLAVQECGLGAEWVRPPRLPLTGSERKQILQVIHAALENRPPIPRKRLARP